jgi:hypothetical protein
MFLMIYIARDSIGEEVLRMFHEERQLHGDFVTKISDMVWRRNGANVDALEATESLGNAAVATQTKDVSSAKSFLLPICPP